MMDDSTTNLRAKFYHPNPKKPQHSPHCHTPIIYGAKVQYAAETPTTRLLKAPENSASKNLSDPSAIMPEPLTTNSW